MAVAIVVTSALLVLFTSATVWQFVRYAQNLWCLRCDDGLFFSASNSAYPMLYGSMWTIPLEVKCYLLLLAAGMVFRHRLGVAVTAIAAFALVPPLWLFVDFSLAGWHWPVGYLGAFFLAGCFLCFHETLRRRPWVPILGGVVCIGYGHVMPGLMLALPPGAVFIGERSWPALRSAGRFGDLSYGIYLYAWPVQQALVMVLGRETDVALLMALSLAVTVFCALASWHLVEKRALRLKPGRRGALPVTASLVVSRTPATPSLGSRCSADLASR